MKRRYAVSGRRLAAWAGWEAQVYPVLGIPDRVAKIYAPGKATTERARNLAATTRAVHARSYVIGDLKHSNVLVSPKALVTLVDTDSFQAGDPNSLRINPVFLRVVLLAVNSAPRRPRHSVYGSESSIFERSSQDTVFACWSAKRMFACPLAPLSPP